MAAGEPRPLDIEGQALERVERQSRKESISMRLLHGHQPVVERTAPNVGLLAKVELRCADGCPKCDAGSKE